MSFLQRELDRLQGALLDPSNRDRYSELYAAQQALAWALEPGGYASPTRLLMGILEDLEDCSVHRHPLPSSDIYCHNG